MDKGSPRLYALYEHIDCIEVPYVDNAYTALNNIIIQNDTDKSSNYLYSNVMIKNKEDNNKCLFINKYRQITDKTYLENIDNITSRYRNVDGIKDLYKFANYGKRNAIVLGRKYNKTLKQEPILLSDDIKYVNPSYVEENLLNKVVELNEESLRFFNSLCNNDSFSKEKVASVILDRIVSEANKAYYNTNDISYLYELVNCFYELWIYNDNKKTLNYNHLRKLGLFIKEKNEEYELENPKIKQLSFFD
jgi:hypothetical protein